VAPQGYRNPQKSRKRSRKVGFIVLGVILVLIAGGVAWGAMYINQINQNIKVDDENLDEALSERTDPGEPFYMLLLGVDKDQERTEDDEYGSSDNSYRSDSIMLARIDPQDVKVTLVSVHRDTYVDLGEYGEAKINAAFAYGGPSYSVEVLQTFCDVPISHYAQIDMDGFASIIDQIGGIDIYLDIDVYDPDYTGLDLKAGQQHLDGTTAALLSRSRHAYDDYGDGDVYRAANQRTIIEAVVKKVLSDPTNLAATVTTLSEAVQTDMDVSEIVTLATQMRSLDTDNDIYTAMSPTTSTVIDGVYYEFCDVSDWQNMMVRVNQGLPPLEEGAYSVTDDLTSKTTSTDSNSGTSSSSSGSTS